MASCIEARLILEFQFFAQESHSPSQETEVTDHQQGSDDDKGHRFGVKGHYPSAFIQNYGAYRNTDHTGNERRDMLESKLAKKTFYRNYESKEDVLLSLVRTKLRDYFCVVDAGSGDVLTTIFTFAVQNKDLLILL